MTSQRLIVKHYDERGKHCLIWPGYDKICSYAGADLVIWGPQANIEMGPYKFAHIYRSILRFLFVVMLAAAQWCPIVESNVSTFFMYML